MSDTPRTDALYLDQLQWAAKYPTGDVNQNLDRVLNEPQNFKAFAQDLERENTQLRAELAAARRDSERLAAIVKLCGTFHGGEWNDVVIAGDDATQTWSVSIRSGQQCWRGSTVRAAIDSATQAQEGGGR